MIVRFVYINNYNDLIKEVPIDMGGQYLYEFNKGKLIIKNRSEYYVDIFRDIECVTNAVAVVGKNSSGKTTILKILNLLFTEVYVDFEFVCVLEEANCYYIYSNYIDNIDIEKKQISEKFRILNKTEYEEKINRMIVMYASNIFDKSNILSEHERLRDISTNKLLRSYVYNSIKQGTQNTDVDLIEEFKKSETKKKVNYFLLLDEHKQINGNNSFKEIFAAPDTLEMNFIENQDEINKLIKRIDEINSKSGKTLRNIYSRIIDIDFDQDLDSFKTDKNSFKVFFAIYITFETLCNLTIEYELDIEDMLKELNNIISNESNYEKLFDECNKILKMVLQRKKEVVFEEITSINAENKYTTYLKMFKNIKLYAEEINNGFEDYVLNINEVQDIITQFEEVDANIYSDIEEIAKIKIINDDFNKFVYKINIFKARYIYNDTYDLEEELEQCIYEAEDIITGIVDYLNIFINIVKEQVEIVDYVKDKKIKTEIYMENNGDVIEYINDVCTMLTDFSQLVNKSKIGSKKFGDFKYNVLCTSWSDNNLKEVINSYLELEYKTIDIEYMHEDISSGHNAYLDIFSRMVWELNTLDEKDKDILLLIDEADIYLHPEIQVKYFKNLVDFLQIFYSKKNIQIVITSNSPFIISDLPHTNVIYLDNLSTMKVSNKLKGITRTFGANIHDLLINTFFMKDGVIGEFARARINYIIEVLNNKDYKEKVYIYKIIQLLGEPILRKKLMDMYDRVFFNSITEVEKEIEGCKSRLEYLEKLKNKVK